MTRKPKRAGECETSWMVATDGSNSSGQQLLISACRGWTPGRLATVGELRRSGPIATGSICLTIETRLDSNQRAWPNAIINWQQLRTRKMQRNRNMETAAVKWLLIANTIIGFSARASAQNIDVGKMEYQSSCAACHGIDAKGNGPVSKELKTPPTDLTVLTKNNNGVFPYEMVYQVIDGRNSTIVSPMALVKCQFGDTDLGRHKHLGSRIASWR